MHYSDNNSNDVRVDVWKTNGKWYTTIVLKWDVYDGGSAELIHQIFRRCMREQHHWYSGWWATCLEPYHAHGHPLMIKMDDV